MNHTHPHQHLADHSHHGAQTGPPADADGLAEILDLDAHVLADHTAAIIQWLPLASPPSKIVDLGCGTGAGTFALLDRFPQAHVTAVDASAAHLKRLRDKAVARGVEARVRTVQADLDADDWPDLGTPDLVWASAAMHHMARPDSALRAVHRLLSPTGLLAVVELSGQPRFLPETAPEERPGLEERCHEAADHLHSAHVPHRGADWGPKLTEAGFTVEGERTITVHIDGSDQPDIGVYALGVLQRVRHSVAGTLAPQDLAALDRLLDLDGPGSILRRDDLAVRTDRTVWAARRSG
ncbi:class I SAM-dependent methyltransferase [Streptomyces sp. NPDC003635]